MGGGTWIYLGTFPSQKAIATLEPIVTLTNLSEKGEGMVITADAVKIGGGMGNIARPTAAPISTMTPPPPKSPQTQPRLRLTHPMLLPKPYPEQTLFQVRTVPSRKEKKRVILTQLKKRKMKLTKLTKSMTKQRNQRKLPDARPADTSVPAEPMIPSAPKTVPTFRTSGMPRFLEGARYWLQWAGFPEPVYAPYHGSDDYKDDYTSRGNWVNYLAGGLACSSESRRSQHTCRHGFRPPQRCRQKSRRLFRGHTRHILHAERRLIPRRDSAHKLPYANRPDNASDNQRHTPPVRTFVDTQVNVGQIICRGESAGGSDYTYRAYEPSEFR